MHSREDAARHTAPKVEVESAASISSGDKPVGSELENGVLLIDDDADIRAIVAQVLELEGYRVHTACDGAQALKNMRLGPPPRLILLDLMMPGMNGWQFRRAQLADPTLATIPVVVLSGGGGLSAEPDDIGAAGFLRKPIDLTTLLEVVDRFR